MTCCRYRRGGARSSQKGDGVGSILGNRVTRVEDLRLLTDGGRYVDDIVLPGAAWLTYVRSPVAHAAITAIDVSEAQAAEVKEIGGAGSERTQLSLPSAARGLPARSPTPEPAAKRGLRDRKPPLF